MSQSKEDLKNCINERISEQNSEKILNSSESVKSDYSSEVDSKIISDKSNHGGVEFQEKKKMPSFAFLNESKVIHTYIASRGQREKECEIYEVLPAVVWVKLNRDRVN